MAEYIERSVGASVLRAKANMAVLMDAAPYFEKAAQILEKLPAADAAPVVRCKDCKHYKPDEYECGCDFAGGLAYVKAEDYCSYGERREADG